MTSGEPDAPLQPEQDTTTHEQTQARIQAQHRLRDRLLLLLAAVAGYTDAISYVALRQVFAANMTGSTVLLGISLAQRDAFLLVVYFLAALLAGLLLVSATDTGVRLGLIPLAPVVIIVALIALRNFRASTA